MTETTILLARGDEFRRCRVRGSVRGPETMDVHDLEVSDSEGVLLDLDRREEMTARVALVIVHQATAPDILEALIAEEQAQRAERLADQYKGFGLSWSDARKARDRANDLRRAALAKAGAR